MSIWKTSSTCTEKPWGTEIRFCSPFGIAGKIIKINTDQRTSLKYYKHRNQVMYCLSGKISVFAPKEKEFGDYFTEEGNYFELVPGEAILIQCQNPYRLKALVDSCLLEVLIGPGYNQEGITMLEDDYGRMFETGGTKP